MNTILDEKTTNEISDKIDGIELPVPKFINAPEDIASAVDRIMRLETALDDLARAVEIAVLSRQFDLVDGFKDRAIELLINKIVIEQPKSNEPFKVTIVDINSKEK
jgi:hypothetical protein